MGSILITGATGFVGSRLLAELQDRKEVVCIARSKPAEQGKEIWYQGSFHSFEDLRQLDKHDFDAVVHLAAVTGGCSEEDGIAVNVAGTRRMMRYLVDRGCKKFILASSICACGALTVGEPRFIPLQLPIKSDHPFRGNDAYGLSKALMEEMAYYISKVSNADITAFRLGAVVDEIKAGFKPVHAADLALWGFVMMGKVALGDVTRAIRTALDADLKPGYRQYNLVGPDNACVEAVADLIPAFLGDQAKGLDLSPYTEDGHEFDALYEMNDANKDLGFKPEISVRATS